MDYKPVREDLDWLFKRFSESYDHLPDDQYVQQVGSDLKNILLRHGVLRPRAATNWRWSPPQPQAPAGCEAAKLQTKIEFMSDFKFVIFIIVALAAYYYAWWTNAL